LKLARLPLSLAATLAALPSISEIPFLDSRFCPLIFCSLPVQCGGRTLNHYEK